MKTFHTFDLQFYCISGKLIPICFLQKKSGTVYRLYGRWKCERRLAKKIAFFQKSDESDDISRNINSSIHSLILRNILHITTVHLKKKIAKIGCIQLELWLFEVWPYLPRVTKNMTNVQNNPQISIIAICLYISTDRA